MTEIKTQDIGAESAKQARLHKVFVYGTLKRTYHNFHYLKNAKYLGEGHIEGIMFHCGGFPAVSLAERFCQVKGEVFEATDDEVYAMDKLEGHPDWYLRIQIHIFPYGLCWVYTFPRQFSDKENFIIPGGEWKGAQTPTVRWLGFNKGVQVGNFSAYPELDTIRVGSGDRFVLKRNLTKGTYDLLARETGEFVGSYKHLGDMEGKDGKVKPILRLPADSRPSVSHAVREHMAADGKVTVSNLPVMYNPPPARTPPLVLEHSPQPAQLTQWEKEKAKKLVDRIEAMGLKVKVL